MGQSGQFHAELDAAILKTLSPMVRAWVWGMYEAPCPWASGKLQEVGTLIGMAGLLVGEAGCRAIGPWACLETGEGLHKLLVKTDS